MKAIINQELVRKSWSGRSILTTKLIGTKENIEHKVNDYIAKRLSETNKIPVKCFNVEIQTQRGKRVHNWSYTPTYR